MARYKIILSYDGTAFSGLQRQTNARTVQAVVEDGLKQIGWQGISTLAAGRTDAGVHADGQVIAFDFDWKHTLDDLLNAINASLPDDTAVQKLEQVGDKFHPRFDAVLRHYRYEIFCQPQRDPLRERYAWRIWPQIDLADLTQAAKQLVGEFDFAPFGTPPKEGGTTIRKVSGAKWKQEGDRFTFEVSANAFLYHMVRRMVNIQIQIAQGKHEPGIIKKYLNGEFDEMIQGLAPPQGLYLTKVDYAEDKP